MSPVEVRDKLREKAASMLPALGVPDPLDQTDDNVFAMFDADADE